MIFKASTDRLKQLEKAMKDRQPCSLVEIPGVAIDPGNQEYPDWIRGTTQ